MRPKRRAGGAEARLCCYMASLQARLTTKEYWDQRYTLDPEPFDWYQRYGTCKPYRELVKRHISPSDQILLLGAGSSRLGEEMYADKYRSICNVDFSSTCVRLLNERYRELNQSRPDDDKMSIENAVMDVRQMEFSDGSFDAALDKTTLDVIMVGESAAENASKYLKEVARVLRPSSVFLLLSSGDAEQRTKLLQNASYGWTVTKFAVSKPTIRGQNAANLPVSADVGGGNVHHLFVCTKGNRAVR